MKRLVLLAVIMAAAGCDKFSNTVKVTNGTESEVREIIVSVCDSTWTIDELAPGDCREFTVVYTRDDSFLVETPAMSGSFGYVTHGITGDRVAITLREDSIQFLQTTDDY